MNALRARDPALSAGGIERLAQLERAIAEAADQFEQVGRALTTIKNRRLYRLRGCTTFPEYLHDHLGLSTSQAYRKITAVRVLETLRASDAPTLPANEAQARELAVVVRFSRAHRRYEHQGVLVEEAAIAQAEAECLDDEDARARRRDREAERRAVQDVEFQRELAGEIARLFPECPPERREEIAAHTAQRGSGRVGRTAAGRALEPEAITLAVVAAARYADTDYDDLLMAGVERADARSRVRAEVEQTLERWRGTS